MSARSLVIVEHERGIIRPTDGDLLLSKPEAGAGQGAGRDEQALWLTASGPLGSGWLDGAGAGRAPPASPGAGRRWGSPRPARWDLGGLTGRDRGCRRCLRADVEGPNRSVRTTPTAAITNNHRTARKASLTRVRVSAFIGSCVLGVAVAGAGCLVSLIPAGYQ